MKKDGMSSVRMNYWQMINLVWQFWKRSPPDLVFLKMISIRMIIPGVTFCGGLNNIRFRGEI